jgi:sugar/nucleoside kinase (ribokinase family)
VETKLQTKARQAGKSDVMSETMAPNGSLSPPAEGSIVIGTGLLTLDVVINAEVRGVPRLYAGGTCGNVLTILSYLGWQSYPVARLNGDTASKRVLRDLKDWGVNVSFAKQSPKASTPIIVHQISRRHDGTPSHKFTWTCPQCGAWLPSYKAITNEAANKIALRIKAPKVFFMDRVSRGILTLAKTCAEKGALVIFEPASAGDPKLFAEALAVSHILKYSHDRVHAFADLLKEASRPALEIETRGREGLRYRSRLAGCSTEQWRNVVAYPVSQFKDSAGAGDWCSAGLIHALGQNGMVGFLATDSARLLTAIRLGQAMAAWTCKFEGARGGMYEVDKESFRASIEELLSDVSPENSTRGVSKVKKASRQNRSICPACDQSKGRNSASSRT